MGLAREEACPKYSDYGNALCKNDHAKWLTSGGLSRGLGPHRISALVAHHTAKTIRNSFRPLCDIRSRAGRAHPIAL